MKLLKKEVRLQSKSLDTKASVTPTLHVTCKINRMVSLFWWGGGGIGLFFVILMTLGTMFSRIFFPMWDQIKVA